MQRKIHFISGLPRSGSTLLAAILRQNPSLHAAMTTPLCELLGGLLQKMSLSDTSLFMSNTQRSRILRDVVGAYYADLPRERVVFDTSRGWCGVVSTVAQLFPDARVVCCVRSPAWILDSLERLVHRNAFLVSKMFGPKHTSNVYTGAEHLMNKQGFIGGPLSFLREAWFGEEAHRLLVLRYESLVAQPLTVISRLYRAIAEPPFEHDFEHLEYDEPEFDARLNMPGLHKVGPRVENIKRIPVLPPDLFKHHNRPFWDMPNENPRGVMIL
jgi:sulfotransferase